MPSDIYGFLNPEPGSDVRLTESEVSIIAAGLLALCASEPEAWNARPIQALRHKLAECVELADFRADVANAAFVGSLPPREISGRTVDAFRRAAESN